MSSSTRSIANQYHSAANAIAARGDKQGGLTVNQQKGITYYRACADKVEALIRPEDSEAEAVWSLESTAVASTGPTKKVTSADKAATPQELLEKANG